MKNSKDYLKRCTNSFVNPIDAQLIKVPRAYTLLGKPMTHTHTHTHTHIPAMNAGEPGATLSTMVLKTFSQSLVRPL